jgi:hypothetical protein
MEHNEAWRSGEVVAWTDHDGVRPAPRPPSRVVSLVLAAALGVVFVGMLSADTLCPEHRQWVIGLGMLGIVFTAVAVVGLVQGWAASPLITLLVSIDGVAIGLIDATHDPSRGRLIAVAFAVTSVLAAALTWRSLRLALWDRDVHRSLRPLPAGAHHRTAPVDPVPVVDAPAGAASVSAADGPAPVEGAEPDRRERTGHSAATE